ncbi:MAG: GTPase [Clostridium sp.]
MKKVHLKELGLTERYIQEATIYEGDFYIARVSVEQRGLYTLICEFGEIKGEVSGKFKYEARDLESFPAVGDWVLVDRKAIEEGVISEERLKNYKKLQRELIYSELSSGGAEKEKIISMFGSVSAMKQATRHIKNKNKNKFR